MARRITAVSSDIKDKTIVKIDGRWYPLLELIAAATAEDAQDYRNQIQVILENAHRFLDPRRTRPL